MTVDGEQVQTQNKRQQFSISSAKPPVRAAKMTMYNTVVSKKEYTDIWSQAIQTYSDYLIRF